MNRRSVSNVIYYIGDMHLGHKKVIEYSESSYVTEAQVMNYFADKDEFRSERFPNATYEFNDLVSEFIHYLPF